MNEPTRVTQKDIGAGLVRLGLRPGDVVLAHSSLSRLGRVESGADAVIEALFGVLGPEGTLMMSGITTTRGFVAECIRAADAGRAADVEPFDPAETETWAGRIPETFRRRAGVIRSLHPTHSVTAFGARAEEMCRGHENAPGPCGEGTPYGRLMELDRGFILLLGVNHHSNTTLHAVEERAGLEYVLYFKPCRIPVIGPDGPSEVRTRVHVNFIQRRMCALETQYIDGRAETVTVIGDSFVRLVRARGMHEITAAALGEDPWALVTPEGREMYERMRSLGDFGLPRPEDYLK